MGTAESRDTQAPASSLVRGSRAVATLVAWRPPYEGKAASPLYDPDPVCVEKAMNLRFRKLTLRALLSACILLLALPLAGCQPALAPARPASAAAAHAAAAKPAAKACGRCAPGGVGRPPLASRSPKAIEPVVRGYAMHASAARSRPTTKRSGSAWCNLAGGRARALWSLAPPAGPEASAKRVVDQLQRRGALAEARRWPQVLVGGPEQVVRPGLIAKVKAARGVFFTGGLQGAHRRCAAAQWSDDAHARRHLGRLPPGRRGGRHLGRRGHHEHGDVP